MPGHQRLRSHDLKNLEDGWKPAIKLDGEQAIAIVRSSLAPAHTPQYDQLLPERRILGLKPRLRSERRDQDTRNEPEEPDHPISLRDSPSASVERDFRYTQRFE